MSLFDQISHVHLRPFTKQPTGREDTLRVPYHMKRETPIRWMTKPRMSLVFGESPDGCSLMHAVVAMPHDDA